jgi:hypothetical protein
MSNFASRLPKQMPCCCATRNVKLCESGGSFRSKNRATHIVKLCESGASEAKTVPLRMLNFASRELPKQKNVILTMLNFVSRELPKQKPSYSQCQTLQFGSFRSKNRATHKVKLCKSGASETKTLLPTMLNFASWELLKPCDSQCYTLRVRTFRSKNGRDFSPRLWAAIAPGNGL